MTLTMRGLGKSYVVAVVLMLGCLCRAPTTLAGGSVYNDALAKSLLFFEAQRSGWLPPDQRIKWRSHSGLKDGFDSGVDLVGGYYDSGDHVKFGFPMAFSMTILSWGVIEYEKELKADNQFDHALGAIKWGTDYFVKAHRNPNVLWCQVGDGDSDHACWERPETMSTPRTAYKVDNDHPGSDVAGETAAAMAAASIAFKPYNVSYSNLLLLNAKQLFTFADTFRGKYDDSVPSAHEFYPSSGYNDELLWAAAWLFRATNDQSYLKYVVDNGPSLSGTTFAVKDFSWDNKFAGVQILLSKVLMDNPSHPYNATLKQYQAKAEYYLCACIQKNGGFNVPKTPGGLLFFYEWNNMQHVSASAFLQVVYSDYLLGSKSQLNCPDGQIPPPELVNFARSQVDYILGKNPRSTSYMIGYGSQFPQNVHHRSSSIPDLGADYFVGCNNGFEEWFNNWKGNPNVLTGALVGGPNINDEYFDKRTQYEQSEPSLTGNAPLVGLFAKLDAISQPTSVQNPPHTTQHFSTGPTVAYSPDSPVEFIHIIAGSWTKDGKTYYRHMVTVRNTGSIEVTDLKLKIENLSGPIWGLSPTNEKDIYVPSPENKILAGGGQFFFVYIQGATPAKITIMKCT